MTGAIGWHVRRYNGSCNGSGRYGKEHWNASGRTAPRRPRKNSDTLTHLPLVHVYPRRRVPGSIFALRTQHHAVRMWWCKCATYVDVVCLHPGLAECLSIQEESNAFSDQIQLSPDSNKIISYGRSAPLSKFQRSRSHCGNRSGGSC
jgi:hypothetical protein